LSLHKDIDELRIDTAKMDPEKLEEFKREWTKFFHYGYVPEVKDAEHIRYINRDE